MDEIVIRLHSVVDIITNSSTVIYTGVTDAAVDAVKGIINEVLWQIDSDKCAEDLFDIHVVTKDEIPWDADDYEERYAAQEEKINKVGHQVDAESVGDAVDGGVYQRSAIVVTSKGVNGTAIVSDLLAKIFVVDAGHG